MRGCSKWKTADPSAIAVVEAAILVETGSYGGFTSWC